MFSFGFREGCGVLGDGRRCFVVLGQFLVKKCFAFGGSEFLVKEEGAFLDE